MAFNFLTMIMLISFKTRRPTSYKQLINGPAIILNYNIWQYTVQVLPTGTEIWLQSILFMSRFLFFLFGITEGFILKVLFFSLW